MPPVALTCPLWWVARWATRMLTSLAVVGALALGAGASPTSATVPSASAGPLATSSVAPGSPSSRWVVPTGAADHAVPVAVDQAAPPTSSEAQPATLAIEAAVPADAGTAAVVPGSRRSPHTADPATRASRAPPGR